MLFVQLGMQRAYASAGILWNIISDTRDWYYDIEKFKHQHDMELRNGEMIIRPRNFLRTSNVQTMRARWQLQDIIAINTQIVHSQ